MHFPKQNCLYMNSSSPSSVKTRVEKCSSSLRPIVHPPRESPGLVFTPVVPKPAAGFLSVGLFMFLSKLLPALRALWLLGRSLHLMKYPDKHSQAADERSCGSARLCVRELLPAARRTCAFISGPSAENKSSSLAPLSPAICNQK